MAMVLAGFMTFCHAAPDKSQKEDRPAAESSQDDPISKLTSPGEDAVGDLLLQAVSLLGVAYKFGGSSPTTGLDCSGFIQYVFQKSLKVNLPRTSAEMARTGRAVDKGELAPGDLVFFNTRGFANSHVGIYMGNGKFIHAPRTGKNIEVANINQSYWVGRYNGARRVARGVGQAEPVEIRVRNAEAAPAGKAPATAAAAPVIKCAKGARGRKCRQEAARTAKAAAAEKPAKGKSAKAGNTDKPGKDKSAKPGKSAASPGKKGKKAKKR
ncbi:hypothetical protein GCM10011289_34640 [Paludibacterium paludis]|uniref:NlpC/P60 domain-containing protein n=2 Tax=Paludibacterium paludis TaxID=1225769 RepID=A0A918UC68_9NEIS|nr:hypothetical protein GCM10011289_34640 [Paludibacterium paludis]